MCTDSRLVPMFRGGIELDICDHCQGIWLDRGELDRLMERVVLPRPSAATPAASPTPSPPAAVPAEHAPTTKRIARRKQRQRKKRLTTRLSDILDEITD